MCLFFISSTCYDDNIVNDFDQTSFEKSATIFKLDKNRIWQSLISKWETVLAQSTVKTCTCIRSHKISISIAKKIEEKEKKIVKFEKLKKTFWVQGAFKSHSKLEFW